MDAETDGKSVLQCPISYPMASSMPIPNQIGPQEFPQAAILGSDFPYLNGRDKTAKKLGIGSFAGKRLVGQLLSAGLVTVEGNRLKVVGEDPQG
jgi:hypothetical protein